MTVQLVPKAPRRKRQPSAAVMREQLASAADRIIDLESENAKLRESNEAACAALWERSWLGRLSVAVKRWWPL